MSPLDQVNTTQFHTAMVAFGKYTPGDSFVKEKGQICHLSKKNIFEQALNWLPCFKDTRVPLTQAELANEIVSLFANRNSIALDEAKGLSFCRKLLSSHIALAPHVQGTIERLEGFLNNSPGPFAIPREIVSKFGSLSTLRATCSTFRKRFSVESLFTEQKILNKASLGDPHAVRRLASYIALQIKLEHFAYATNVLNLFYSDASVKAKEQFWRAVFCNGHWTHFAKLSSFEMVSDLSLKLDPTQHIFAGFVDLVGRCPNLQSLTIKNGRSSGREMAIALVQALMKCSQLQSLKLIEVEFFDYSALDQLVIHPSLTSLTLHSSGHTTALYTFVKSTLSLFSMLEELSLENSNSDSVAMLELPLQIADLSRLKILQVRGFIVASDHSTIFEKLPELKKVSLVQATGPALLKSIGSCTKIQDLALYTKLVSHHFLQLHLANLKELRSITLFAQTGDEMQASFLTALLRNCPEISSVIINNCLTVENAAELTEFVQVLGQATKLQKLLLRLNISSPELYTTLLALPNLHTLAIETHIPSHLTIALQQAAPTNALKRFSYKQQDPYKPDFFAALSTTLPALQNLTLVGRLTDEGLVKLSPTLPLQSLTLNGLQMSHVSASGLSHLMQIHSLQKCKFLGYTTLNSVDALRLVQEARHLRSFSMWSGSANRSIQLSSQQLTHLHTLFLNTEQPILGAPLDQMRWSLTPPQLLEQKLS